MGASLGEAGRFWLVDMVTRQWAEVRPNLCGRLTITGSNKGSMPHKLGLIQIESMEKVGAVANALLTDPQAFEKHYSPEMEEVIRHTPLMEHNEWWYRRYNLNAPEEFGQYPFICTFPGHWKIMKGILTN